MLILGIDPGTARCGYGVIKEEGSKLILVDSGLISTPSKQNDAERLCGIFSQANDLIKKHSPDVVSVEQLFFATNARTAFSVGQARGVVILAAAMHGIPVAEFTPLQVKQTVVGYGKADKAQVQYMVKTILKMKETPHPDDIADALAVAICYAHSHTMKEKMEVARS